MELFELPIGTTTNYAFSTQGMATIRALYDASGARITEPSSGNNTLVANLIAGNKYYLALASIDGTTGMYDMVITGGNQAIDGDILTHPAPIRARSISSLE